MLGGSSRIDITPTDPVPMQGYAARTKPSKGVHDPLFARALVLDDGAQRVAVVACDLGGFAPDTARRLRERIADRTGILIAHTLLACSHTHAGPLVARRPGSDPAGRYMALLEERVVHVACNAVEALTPARVGVGEATVHLGVNRRERTPEGTIKIGRNPAGPSSSAVPILSIVAEQGAPMAVLFSYGAHPVVLGPENLQLSGDYAGRAEREVEGNFGDRLVALFALGFAGDVNVDAEERSFDEVETTGVALGRAVLEEMKTIETAATATLAARSITVPLPLEPPPSLVEAERVFYQERDRLSQVLGRGTDEATVAARRAAADWAARLVDIAREDAGSRTVDLELQALAIGDVVLVGLSAEVFAAYGDVVAELSPFAHTIALSVANGSVGYIPTAAAFAEGGYEVERAPRYFNGLPFRPEVEGVVRDALAQLLQSMAPPGEPVPEQTHEE